MQVSGIYAHAEYVKTIPAGLIGGKIEFDFTDSRWDNLNKTVVFKGFGTKDVFLNGNTAVIPQEVIAYPRARLFVGIYGTDAENNIAIPTLWADLGTIQNAADPSGDEAAEPTLPIWAQLQQDIEALKKGCASDEQIAKAVEAYLDENPIETPDLTDQVNRAETAATAAATSATSAKNAAINAQSSAWSAASSAQTAASSAQAHAGSASGSAGFANTRANEASAAATRAEKAAKRAEEAAESANSANADCVKTVNGVEPDENGNVEITIPDSGGNVELDTTLTQSGKAADAKAVGDKIAEITGISLVEPAEDDIPKVYFTGTLPTSKTEEGERLTMHYISKTADFIYPVTLNVQGHSSAGYPKKNFTLKPYKDSTYESKKKLAFKNWPEMNKFVLKAHWIDHSHVRNVGTAKIWGKIVKSRSDYESLPEELRNAPNNGATDGFTCKVFCNGVYQGLYEWIVPKDKLFGQDDDIATHSILNSEWNNQPTCAFATTSPTMSGNWSEELQDSLSSNISTSFANLIKFVAGSTDEEFVANAENYFDVQSVIDYDIFARIFCIVDNLCRNQIFFTYDGAKWYEGAWDLDAVLGLPPTTRGFFAYNTEFQTGYIAYKDHSVTNLLYQRVENLFRDRFKTRYWELRSGVLSIENILDVYERLTDIITTYDGLLAEDYASTTGGGAFTGIPYKTENTIQQIRNFVAQRIPYMDGVIAAMIDPVPCTGISLSASSLTFTAEGTQTITATVTPADCTYDRVWVSSNPSVATIFIDGNVCTVTAVANGDTTITVTCGDYSASCAVSVSGMKEAVPCTGISLSASSLNFTEIGSQTLVATVEPTDTTDPIEWSVNPSGVVTVDGGVVTAISAGACVITAKCGEQSATCSVSVSLPVDYTLNPLANVEWQLDTKINTNTGALEAQTGENITTRFTLQNCVYNPVTPSGSTWPSVYIWDKNGAYLGYIQNGSGNLGEFVARSDYSYALGFANSATDRDFSGASLMPVDKRENAVDTVNLSLSDFTWSKTGNGWEADITEALSSQGVTVANLQNGTVSASYMLRLGQPNPGINKNGIEPWFTIRTYGSKSLLIAGTSHSTVDEFKAWTEESGAVLTIN